jgi:SRSO17 transposase
MGIQSSTRVWPPGLAPLHSESYEGKGGPPRILERRVPGHDPVPVKDLALALEPSRYHTISWRGGTPAALNSRFAAVRARASHRDYWPATPRDEEWLLIEWSISEPEPTRYWLSTLPEDTAVERLVHVAKMRWRIERDYQDQSRSSASGTSRDGDGVDSIITQLYASWRGLWVSRRAAPRRRRQ